MSLEYVIENSDFTREIIFSYFTNIVIFVDATLQVEINYSS